MVFVRFPRLQWLVFSGAFSTLAVGTRAHADDEGFGGAAPDGAPVTNASDGALEVGDEAERPPARETELTRAATPFKSALDAARATQKRTPLVILREEVRAFDDETARADAAQRAGTIDEVAREAVHAAYKKRRAVLDDVEVMGLRLRERCLRARGESATLPGLLPRGIRVSRDSEAIGMLLAFPDGKDCDRQVLVDDDVVARIERLHEIERIVPDLGYHRLAERRALEAERETLLDDLMGRTDDRPVRLQFTSKRHDPAATLEKLRPQGTLLEKRGENPGPVTPIR
jgi:hypothetical protein